MNKFYLLATTLLILYSVCAIGQPIDFVAYYPFNGNANDESLNDNNGTVNSAVLATDRFGNANSAYEFDGIDDYISIGEQDNLLGVTNAYTLSTWIYYETQIGVDPLEILSFESSRSSEANRNAGYALSISGEAPVGLVGVETTVESERVLYGDVLSASNWYHIAFTRDQSNGKMYINGELVSETTGLLADDISYNGNAVEKDDYTFGASENPLIPDTYGNFFKGKIDDIRVYNRVLSSTEIVDLSTENNWPLTSCYNLSLGTDIEFPIARQDSPTLDYNSYVTVSNDANDVWSDRPGAIIPATQGKYIFEAQAAGWYKLLSTNVGSASFEYRYFAYDVSTNQITQNFQINYQHQYNSSYIDVLREYKYASAMPVNYQLGANEVLGYYLVTHTHGAGGRYYNYEYHYNSTLTPSYVDVWYENGGENRRYYVNNACGDTQTDGSLIAHYTFDNSFDDISGNSNNGTANGGVSFVTDRFGNASSAASFDGVDDNIDIGNASNYDSPEGTVIAWFKVNKLNSPSEAQYIISDRRDPINDLTTDNYLRMAYSNLGTMENRVKGTSDQASIAGSEIIRTDFWYQSIITWGSNGMKSYLNGELEGQDLSYTNSWNGTRTMYIGTRDDYNGYLDGTIDDIRIYSRALSTQEIADLYSEESGLIAHYTFDGDAQDQSGNGNHGTVNGATPATDRFGNASSAYSFDGTNDNINFGHNTSQAFVNQLTLLAWVNPTEIQSPQQFVISKWGGSNSNESFYLALDDTGIPFGKINFTDTQEIVPTASSSISLNSWSLLGMTYDGANANLFVNGVAVATIADTRDILSGTLDLIIGDDNVNNLPFKGSIDDARIYNRALSAQEIADLYSEESGLIAYYTFDGDAQDQSGNGNHGTENGGVSYTTDRFGNASGSVDFTGSESITLPVDMDDYLDRMTFLTWVNFDLIDEGTDSYILSQWNNPNGYGMYVDAGGGGALRFFGDEPTTGDPSYSLSELTENKWYMIAGVSDGANKHLYLNGALVDSNSNTWNDSGLSEIILGDAFAAPVSIDGKVDDLKIYNRALSAQEIADLYSEESGLIAHYTFDGDAQDQSGNGNHGTENGGVSYTTDRFGNASSAASFDGVDDNIDIGNASNYDSPEGTVIAWFKVNKLNSPSEAQYIISDRRDPINDLTTDNYLRMAYSNLGTMENRVKGTSNQASIAGSEIIRTDFWYQSIITWGSNGMKSYLNGELEGQDLSYTDSWNGTRTMYIGTRDDYNGYLDGTIDDIRIYNRALSAQEIADLYSEESGLIAHYIFDSDAQDQSGNGNHGTENGGVSYTTDRFGNASGAASFDGVDGKIETFDLDESGSISVSAWINNKRLPSDDHEWFFGSNDDNRNNPGFVIGTDQTLSPVGGSDHWIATISNGSLNYTDFDLGQREINRWYHFTMTHDNNTNENNFYIDGQLVQSGTQEMTDIVTTVSLGKQGVSEERFSNVDLDDIQIWNRALSAQEIADLYSEESGLIGHYTFNGDAQDQSGNGNHGTENGGVSYTTDRFGNAGGAASFDGVDAFIAVTNESAFDINSITISVWINQLSSTFDDAIVGKHNSTLGSYGWFLNAHSSHDAYRTVVSTDGSNSFDLNGTTPLDYNNWHHVTMTYDQEELLIYRDGILESTNTDPSGPLYKNDESVQIGKLMSQAYFEGSMDDILIYNRSLSTSEIQALYNEGGWDINDIKSFDIPGLVQGSLDINADSHTITAEVAYGTDITAIAPNITISAGAEINPATSTTQDFSSGPVTYTITAADGSMQDWEVAITEDHGLVAHYTFENSFNDVSGNDNHGTGNGGISFTTDRFGNASGAASFDGNDDYVDTPILSDQLDGDNNWTSTLWFKTSSSGEFQTLLSTYDGWSGASGDWLLDIDMVDDHIQFRTDAGNYDLHFESSVSNDSWHFLALTYTHLENEISIVLDGSVPQTGTGFTLSSGSAANLRIGSSNNQPTPMTGYIDDIRIYNRALSEEEISDLYNEESGLIAYYPFNGNANDESGNSNNGTANGGVDFTVTDRFGDANSAASFDGVDDEIDCGNIVDGTTYTYAVWFRTNGTPSDKKVVISNFTPSSDPDRRALMFDSSLDLLVFDNDIGNWVTMGTVQDGVWQFAAITQSNNQLKAYLNGDLVVDQSNTVIATTGTFNIGSFSTSVPNYFNGDIDDVQIWNRALSASEIEALYGNFCQPTTLTVDDYAITDNTDCNGNGSIDITAVRNGGIAEGLANYTFAWTAGDDSAHGGTVGSSGAGSGNVLSDLSPGDYKVTITESASGCTSEAITITVDDDSVNPTVTAVLDSEDSGCEGGTRDGQLSANVQGETTGYDFEWFVGSTPGTAGTGFATTAEVSGLAAGSYSVRATDNTGAGLACFGEANIELTSSAEEITGTVSINNEYSCDPEVVVSSVSVASVALVSVPTTGYTYTWDDNSDFSSPSSSGASATTFSGQPAGTYYLQITNNTTNCSSAAIEFTIDNNCDPIAYYPFNGNANDESTNSTNATAEGEVDFTAADRFQNSSKALELYGGSAGLVQINQNDIFSDVQKLSISLWVKLDDVNTEQYFFSNNQAFVYCTSSGNLGFGIDDGVLGSANLNTNYSFVVDQWTHIAAVYDGSDAYLYVNGELEDSSTLGKTVGSTLGNTYLGGNSPNTWIMDGLLDDVTLYNRDISSLEISNLYTDGGWPISSETDILTFSIPNQMGVAHINTDDHTVTVEGEYGIDLTSVMPTITMSDGATIDPIVGSTLDFSSPVTYTVTAENGVTQQQWVVTVTENDGLFAYYPFNGNADDASGNANHGTVSGPTLSNDRFGIADQAYRFATSVQDKIDIPFHLDDALANFSVSFWIKIPEYNTAVDQFIMSSNGNGSNGWGITFDQAEKKLKFFGDEFSNGDLDLWENDLIENDWIHVVGISDGLNKKLYVNNKLVDTYGNAWNSSLGTNIVFGSNANATNGSSFVGYLDDVRIYKRPLDEIEIRDLYFEGDWASYFKTESYELNQTPNGWRFIEETAEVAVDGKLQATTVGARGSLTRMGFAPEGQQSMTFKWDGFIESSTNASSTALVIYNTNTTLNFRHLASTAQNTDNTFVQVYSDNQYMSDIEYLTDELLPIKNASYSYAVSIDQQSYTFSAVEIGSDEVFSYSGDLPSSFTIGEIDRFEFEVWNSSFTNTWIDNIAVEVFETNIETFELPQQTGAAKIDKVNHTVEIEVEYGTGLDAITPTITVSEGASISPASGELQDFTNPVTYTVTGADGTTTQEWVVIVTVDDDLIAYYPFNGNSNDESGNDLHPQTDASNVVLVSDRFGNTDRAYSFNGEDAWLGVTHEELLNFTNDSGEQLSLLVWVKTTDDGTLIAKFPSDGGEEPGYKLDIEVGKIVFLMESSPGPVQHTMTGPLIADDQWHFVAFTLDAEKMGKLYVDNNLEVEQDLSSQLSTENNWGLSIGSQNGNDGTHLEGLIDDIRIYYRALSASRIAELYGEGGWPLPSVGINVSTQSISIAEPNLGDKFTVQLYSPPTSDVVLSVVSDNTSIGTVDISTLTFTSSNWDTPQEVVVSPVNDDLVEDDVTFNVIISVNDDSTDDTYDELEDVIVEVTRQSDDEAGYKVSETSLSTTEDETTATFTIVLDKQPQGEVSFEVRSEDETEGTVSPTSVVFGGGNWDTPQTVTVTGVDDEDVDGDITYNITVSVDDANSDDFFDALEDKTVSVTNEDVQTAPVFGTLQGLVDSHVSGSGNVDLSIDVTDAENNITKVTLMKKPSADPGDGTSVALTANGASYAFSLSDIDFDELGVSFWLIAEDEAGLSEETEVYTIATETSGDTEPLPDIVSSEDQLDYSIIAMPLERISVSVVFEGLGQFKKAEWRLLHYNGNDSYHEYPTNFSNFEPGKGYWFLTNKPANFNLKGGSAVHASNEEPFTISLRADDWTMIGNPYPFHVDWDEVISHNAGKGIDVDNVVTFKKRDWNRNLAGGVTLNKYDGALLFSATAQTIEIPVSAKKGNGRMAGGNRVAEKNILGSDSWELGLNLSNDILGYNVSSVGMKQEASSGKDKFDWGMLPRFDRYLDIAFDKNLTKSIVGVSEEFVWDFTVNSNMGEINTLAWDISIFEGSDYGMALLDVSNQRIVDMTVDDAYRFGINGEKKDFKLYFAHKDRLPQLINPEINYLGNPYPNPFSNEVVVPLAVNEDNTDVSIVVFNIFGQEVYREQQSKLSHGYYELTLDLKGKTSRRLNDGAYIMNIEFKSPQGTEILNKKLFYRK